MHGTLFAIGHLLFLPTKNKRIQNEYIKERKLDRQKYVGFTDI